MENPDLVRIHLDFPATWILEDLLGLTQQIVVHTNTKVTY